MPITEKNTCIKIKIGANTNTPKIANIAFPPATALIRKAIMAGKATNKIVSGIITSIDKKPAPHNFITSPLDIFQIVFIG